MLKVVQTVFLATDSSWSLRLGCLPVILPAESPGLGVSNVDTACRALPASRSAVKAPWYWQ